jgi:alkylation response protein AidB-like acyl-CoA dehydrogenase
VGKPASSLWQVTD